MNSTADPKTGNYLKGLMKKAQEAIKLVIGNSEVYAEEDSGGDLIFNPDTMMKISVSFDKYYLPKEKVVKLNVRGNRFFHEIKREIREINGIYIVYPQEYEVQLDVRREEWEKRLLSELNMEYQLALETIHFISEEEIARRYQRKGITSIRKPYNLKQGELLIVAGGFANFNTKSEPICNVMVNLIKPNPENNEKKLRRTVKTDYFGKYSSLAGAYLYVGGEWFHNLFIPEMHHWETPRFFSFRIADDGRSLKFFSDRTQRGIDIRAQVQTKTEADHEYIIYTINPEYLQNPEIEDFKLTISYEIKEGEIKEETPPPIEKFPAHEYKVQVEEKIILPTDTKETLEDDNQEENKIIEDKSCPESESLPYLESEMILLPLPKENDISSYMMTIGNNNKNVKFYASSEDKEVSILAPDKEEKIYHRIISEPVDYSIKFEGRHYSISNQFLSRIDHRILKLYFAWELKTNVIERVCLGSDYYVFGRDPLIEINNELPAEAIDRLIRLNKGKDEFWRIGTSRDHGFLLKREIEQSVTHYLYNISFNYPIYLLPAKSLQNPSIRPTILEPVSGNEKQEKCTAFITRVGNGLSGTQPHFEIGENWHRELTQFTEGKALTNNDLIIIGNRVFKYVVPMVMETALNQRTTDSILRKVHFNKSILR